MIIFRPAIDPRNNTENTTRGIRGTWAIYYGAANPVTGGVIKVRQSCGEVGTTVRRMPTRNSRCEDLPAGFRESFEHPETSFMNATRNFNRSVRCRADYRCKRTRGKRAVRRRMLQMRHKCRRASVFPLRRSS